MAGRAQQRKAVESANRAEVNLTSDGFYNVAVRYDHCQSLASACGVKTDQVTQALLEDNDQRRLSTISEEDLD